ncbi:pyridoxamine 5'-phosphate oxidase family protein [Nocardioides caldifontis]|uniref:pyridoxamine 5'-phosphate oxidase family protein n=1 Tax=Nocardioides caldifontis TaxID=2588938 RepID=UPI0019398203|nr:pyridoxamine 5'-phosphate oxidase family protein [Nocardioides caldifontis]
MVEGPREKESRKADSLAQLSSPAVDVWVATASTAGEPYLVPLSLCWADGRAVIAIDRGSRTARHLAATGRARLGVGPTRDVVMLDAVVERTVGVDEDTELGAAYAAQADWDPRGSEGYVFVVLRPERVQAWREVDEIPGRTLMREGRWLV